MEDQIKQVIESVGPVADDSRAEVARVLSSIAPEGEELELKTAVVKQLFPSESVQGYGIEHTLESYPEF